MSLFANTLNVVPPALFPTVPAIVSATGIDPMVLFVCIVVGSRASAISPFSSGGSLMLGACSATKAGRSCSCSCCSVPCRAAPIGDRRGRGGGVHRHLLGAVLRRRR